jgi:hypothetical protein
MLSGPGLASQEVHGIGSLDIALRATTKCRGDGMPRPPYQPPEGRTCFCLNRRRKFPFSHRAHTSLFPIFNRKRCALRAADKAGEVRPEGTRSPLHSVVARSALLELTQRRARSRPPRGHPVLEVVKRAREVGHWPRACPQPLSLMPMGLPKPKHREPAVAILLRATRRLRGGTLRRILAGDCREVISD